MTADFGLLRAIDAQSFGQPGQRTFRVRMVSAEGDTASEAAVSRVYAMAAGVPDSAILLENEGRTTGQSLQRVARLLRARRLDTVIVVSDPFHVLRASHAASREGLVAIASPTRTDDVWGRVLRQPGYFLGETVKAPLARFVNW